MTFQPGTSGNPLGRPHGDGEVRTLAKAATPIAIAGLIYWAKNRREATACVSACKALLDRAWGTPIQGIELTGKDGQALSVTINLPMMRLPNGEDDVTNTIETNTIEITE